MSNLETIYKAINSRFQILKDVATILEGKSEAVEGYMTRVNTHSGLFIHSVSPIYVKYISTKNDEKRKSMLIKFASSVRRMSTKTNLELLFLDLKNIVSELQLEGEYEEEINSKFAKFKEKTYIPVPIRESDDKCCGVPMSINPHKTEMVCKTCTRIIPYQDADYDRGSHQGQDISRTTNGRYNPNNYVRKAILRLFAREPLNVSDDHLKKMIECRQRDNIQWSPSLKCYQIRCEYMRKILKELKLTTQFNKHIPKLRTMIQGPPTADVSDQEINQIFEDTNEVINVFKTIKPDSKANSPYYYYFIYKVVDLKFRDRPEIRKRILECIHIQDVATIDEIDRKYWRQITDTIPKFRNQFRLTDEQERFDIF